MVDPKLFISAPFEHTLVKSYVVMLEHPSWFYCMCPYPGHMGGCPMYGRQECPPNTRTLFELVDADQEIKLLGVYFDLGEYTLAKAREPLHRDDTFKQLRNSRHWQGSVDAKLRRDALELTGG